MMLCSHCTVLYDVKPGNNPHCGWSLNTVYCQPYTTLSQKNRPFEGGLLLLTFTFFTFSSKFFLWWVLRPVNLVDCTGIESGMGIFGVMVSYCSTSKVGWLFCFVRIGLGGGR
ncbi:hypothetical protein HOY80DRAFT_992100 [Tuber brumale]|nr:hypothetical protein HOY80DRAFT_992100 [Tuber brumale]